MITDDTSGRSSRRMASNIAMLVGALLLMVMPAVLFFYSIGGTTQAHLPGTLVILSSVGGMALVVIGAALRD